MSKKSEYVTYLVKAQKRAQPFQILFPQDDSYDLGQLNRYVKSKRKLWENQLNRVLCGIFKLTLCTFASEETFLNKFDHGSILVKVQSPFVTKKA